MNLNKQLNKIDIYTTDIGKIIKASALEIPNNDAIIAYRSFVMDISNEDYLIELDLNNIDKELNKRHKTIRHVLSAMIQERMNDDEIDTLLQPLEKLGEPYDYVYDVHPSILEYEVVENKGIKIKLITVHMYVNIYNSEYNTEEMRRKFKLCKYLNGGFGDNQGAVNFIVNSEYIRNLKGLYMFVSGLTSDDVNINARAKYTSKGNKITCDAKATYNGVTKNFTMDGNDKKEVRHAIATQIVNEFKVDILGGNIYEEFIRTDMDEAASSFVVLRTPSVWDFKGVSEDEEEININRSNICLGLFVTDKMLSNNKYMMITFDSMDKLPDFECDANKK